MPRFSVLRGMRVSTLMLLVVIAALALGLVVERQNDRKWRAIAEKFRNISDKYEYYYFYYKLEYGLLTNALDPTERRGRQPGRPMPDEILNASVLADYHKKLRDKYRDASYTPWASVGPDPPRPDLKPGPKDSPTAQTSPVFHH